MSSSVAKTCVRQWPWEQDITDHHNNVVTHRRTTRQRHLSTGQDENIATAYFASQYGGQQAQQRTAEVRIPISISILVFSININI